MCFERLVKANKRIGETKCQFWHRNSNTMKIHKSKCEHRVLLLCSACCSTNLISSNAWCGRYQFQGGKRKSEKHRNESRANINVQSHTETPKKTRIKSVTEAMSRLRAPCASSQTVRRRGSACGLIFVFKNSFKDIADITSRSAENKSRSQQKSWSRETIKQRKTQQTNCQKWKNPKIMWASNARGSKLNQKILQATNAMSTKWKNFKAPMPQVQEAVTRSDGAKRLWSSKASTARAKHRRRKAPHSLSMKMLKIFSRKLFKLRDSEYAKIKTE